MSLSCETIRVQFVESETEKEQWPGKYTRLINEGLNKCAQRIWDLFPQLKTSLCNKILNAALDFAERAIKKCESLARAILLEEFGSALEDKIEKVCDTIGRTLACFEKKTISLKVCAKQAIDDLRNEQELRNYKIGFYDEKKAIDESTAAVLYETIQKCLTEAKISRRKEIRYRLGQLAKRHAFINLVTNISALCMGKTTCSCPFDRAIAKYIKTVDPDDVYQQAFNKLVNYEGDIRGKTFQFFIKVLQHAAIDFCNKANRTKAIEPNLNVDIAQESNLATYIFPTIHGRTHEESGLEIEELREAFKELENLEAAVIWLYIVESKTQEQVADELKISKYAMRKKYQKGLKKLRKLLGGNEDDLL